MGTPYSTVAVTGYNSSPPSDDGTQVDSNKVYWSTAKTKLGDPLNTAIAAIDAALVTAFNYTAAEKTADYTTVAGDAGKIIEIGSTVSSAVTITLGQVASMGTSYIVKVVNRSTIAQTVARGGSDTINGSLTSLTIPSKASLTFQVNASNNGYDVIADHGYATGNLKVDATLNVTGATSLAALTVSGAVVGAASQAVFNTVSTTVNAFGAATTLNIGNASGTNTILGATTFSQALTASAGVTLSGSASNIALGSNYISVGGTDAGLNFDGSNNALFSAAVDVTGTLQGIKSTASQIRAYGWDSVSGAGTDRGSIELGSAATYFGRIGYANTGALYLDNAYDNVASTTYIRVRTLGTPVNAAVFNSSGMNGVLGATTPAALAATTGTFSGTITQTGSAATLTEGLVLDGTTTAAHYATFSNTGGNLRLGVDDSTGVHLISGGTAYGGVVGTNNNTTLHLVSNGTSIVQITTTGLAVNGVVDINGTAASATASHLQLGSTTQSTIGANGAASALTANPLGYLIAYLGSTKIVIPYYNA